MSHIVVIGAGQAGQSVCETLRSAGFDGRITMAGAEPWRPYQRPPLSKGYLLGEMARDRLFLRSADWYAEAGVDLRLGTEARDLDPAGRTVRLSDETVVYDHCVLATGLHPRRLSAKAGGDLAGAFTVRTLADIDALEPALRTAGRLVVVGGGYIGLEAAAVARKLGHEVTVIEAGQRILGRVASAETAEHVRQLHRARGVEVIEGATLDRLTGEGGRVTGARLADGREIAADLAIVGIGLLPDCAIARDAGITCDGGVVVDAQGRSSAERVWAAGDCAVFPYRGQPTRLESVQNAIDMGAAVARNIMGAGRDYAPVPWFWSDQYDMKLQIAGLNRGWDRIVTREGTGPSVWYYAGETLLAVDAMGDARAYMVGKRLIEMGRSPDPDTLADPDTDLKALLRS